ncbi:MAG: hypothetical protein ABSF22_16385 [Bryobacteraceae bacterium]
MMGINAMGNFYALYGAVTVAIFAAMKYVTDSAVPIEGEIYAAALASSLPYIMPNIVGAFPQLGYPLADHE